jgi:DNA polymerase-3 subunit alpha
MSLIRGSFRVRGDTLEIYPAYEEIAVRIEFFGDEVERITEVDPLQFPLLIFERFIDVTREDLPDIDIDFPSEVRDQGILRDYLASRYPSVANIGTFTYYKGRLALDDIARVYKVPKFEVETIKNFLIERSSGDLRASSTVEDTIEQFPQAADVVERYPDLKRAELLEGNVRGSGVHAAAYVVASHDIGEVAAIYNKKIGDVYADVVTFDKYDAERQGLLKMDFLGLSTMSALWTMLKWTNQTIDDLYTGPLDDRKKCVRAKCDLLPAGDARNGCYWWVDWLNLADNPQFRYEPIACPKDI